MRKISKVVSIAIGFVFLLNIAQGQGTIKGKITDASTGEALIGASVIIDGTATGSTTDFDGNYIIKGINEGSYNLIASYLGYRDVNKSIVLSQGMTVVEDFELSYAAVNVVDGEEIIITAQAEGQIAAINKQLASNTITNVISAKRMQEVPDANAAETIGRLPGVSIVRSGGEGSKVVVRGLAPKYNKIMIEGVSMASTGSDDRSSDLSSISPYMLEGIELTKAALPDKEANVLGGSINFVLRSAPKDTKLDALIQTGYNSLKQELGNYKIVLGGSKRFMNNKIGIFVQADIENRSRSSYDLNVNYFNQNNPENIDEVDVSIGNLILQDIDRELNRKGGVVVLDYKFNSGKIKLSSFVSNVDKTTTNRSENVRSGLVDHFYTINQKESDLLIRNTALKFEKNFGAFKIDIGLSNAYSKANTPRNITLSAFESAAFDLTKTIPNPNSPEIDLKYSPELAPDQLIQFVKNDIDNSKLSNINQSTSITEQSENSFSADLSYDLVLSNRLNLKFKTGVKFKYLEKDYNFDQKFINLRFSRGKDLRQLIAETYPELGLTNPSSLPHELFIDKEYSLDFPGEHYAINNIPSLDFANSIANLAATNDLYDTHFPNTRKDDYFGNENYSAGYLMSEINYNKVWTFIPGVRYEKNTTKYNGIRGDAQALLVHQGYVSDSITTTRTNSFLLPMFHLRFKPVKWFDLRLAYTKTLNRPNFNRIVPSWNRTLMQVAYNDPNLKVSRSTNIDIYASFYSSKLGLFTIGGFQKEITDLIYSSGSSQLIDPEALGLPLSDANKTIELFVNNKFPVNLSGVELEWQTRFWYLKDHPVFSFLKGAILNINYTHTTSSLKYPNTVVQTIFDPPNPLIIENIDTFYVDRLVLQPNDLFNLTIGYDYKGLSVRGSMLFQNDIFSKTNFWPRHRQTTDKFTKFDISIQQKLPIKGMELLLNLNNITSAADRIVNQGTGYPVREQHFGMTVDFGIRYRL